MLLGRTGLTLGGVSLQGDGELATGVCRIDDVVNLPTGSSHVRRVEGVLVFVDLLGACLLYTSPSPRD